MLLEHNRMVFDNLTAMLANKSCACVIMGTGVGKSYVALEYLTQNNLKALIVSPRDSINKSWLKLCGDKVETITYQKLANIYKDIDYSYYDVVICDEVHHIGAPKWGKPIQYILNAGIKVIGLTESSIRYTDGGRDIAEEFFGGNVVYGESVSSAIEKKILNPVTYVGAMYNSDGLKKTIRGKIQSRLYAKLNLALNKTPTVTEILKKNMPGGKRKGIIFASTIDDIRFAMDFIHSVYPDAQIRFVHSKQSDAYNNAAMEWFKNTDEGYMCSVDMISEGVHIKGVNTLIMLRRTESVNLFNQQLGRCLDASTKEPAILFDLVNNKYSIRIIKNKLRIKVNSIFNSGKLNVVPSEQLIIKDYTKDIVEVLEEIKLSLEGKWTKEEDDIIIDCYTNHYSSHILNDIHILLPHRNKDSINHRAQKLGLKSDFVRSTRTDEEEKFIISSIKSGLSVAQVVSLLNEKFPRRKWSRSSVIKLCKREGIEFKRTRIFWSDEDKAILKEFYPVEGRACLKRLPGKTYSGVVSMAQTLGLVMDKRFRYVKRHILCVELNKEFDSLYDAFKFLGINSDRRLRQAIYHGTVYHGYHWQFIKEKRD